MASAMVSVRRWWHSNLWGGCQTRALATWVQTATTNTRSVYTGSGSFHA
ncbi:hypothetical protein U9M48_043704 [Paspalum notatum var. saurae]|uniref:Uncharacterized protein n=1 Tax=Paspalum notatum var. saurae TaxID=547442 RepID=A0AAQ3UV77_PASNO